MDLASLESPTNEQVTKAARISRGASQMPGPAGSASEKNEMLQQDARSNLL